jgi:hypothetical protein
MKMTKRWLSSSTDRFKSELKDTAFTIFEPVADHGYFTWKFKASERFYNMKDLKSAEQFTSKIVLHGKPKSLVPFTSLKLPHALPSLPVQGYPSNKFPYAGYLAAVLHVAARHRSVVLDDFDFILGGSALGCLATKNSSRSPQVVFRIPCSSNRTTIGLLKNKKYFQDYAAVGFQFERFVTGTKYDPKAPVESPCHIHQMKIGSHRVLFHAETDAFYDGEPAEVKASANYRKNREVTFQLISSGGLWLCHAGIDSKSIQSISLLTLSGVIHRSWKNTSPATFESNILGALAAIKDQMSNAEENDVFDLTFVDGKVKLNRNSSAVVFPPTKIVDELVKSPSDRFVLDAEPELK